MGKLPYMYTDSEDTETPSCSSTENTKKKKKKLSILKYTTNVKKKKCKKHSSKSEPEESEYKSKNSKSKSRLHGILKHDKESSEDEDEVEPIPLRMLDRCLVGRVPRPPGGRPGRGGGVALVVRKNTDLQGFQNLLAQNSTSSTKRSRSMTKKLGRKRSY